MTEAEWLACESPADLLATALPRASERKLRLFGCACCRAYWHLLDAPRRLAVEASERFAEGEGTRHDLAPHRAAAMGVASGTGRTAAEAALAATEAFARSTMPQPLAQPGDDPWMGYWRPRPLPDDFQPRMCVLARCVFAPAARVEASAWRTSDALLLAQAAYAERDPSTGHLDALRLSILADALEEASAADSIVAHLRLPGHHVRGCWAVDLVLARE